MINEIELAKKLSTIEDPVVKKNIINSGRVRGINIYNKNVNIMIERDINNNQNNVDIVKNSITQLLRNIKDIENFKIDVSENTGNKSDISSSKNVRICKKR